MKRLDSLPTKVTMTSLAIVLLFALVTLAWLIPYQKAVLIREKKTTLKEETEIAWSILLHAYEQVQTGRMTDEEAKADALATIERLRFGKAMKGYFGVFDSSLVSLMHPYRKDIVGKDCSGLRDKMGHPFLAQMREKALLNGEGFITYYWDYYDNPNKVVKKISYVRYFRPWGWFIVTGTYMNDIEAELLTLWIRLGVTYLLVAVVGLGLAWFTGRMVQQGLMTGESTLSDSPFKGRILFSLRSVYLWVMGICLSLVTLAWCVMIHGYLKGLIMDGFDQKIRNSSTVTGAFIKGEELKLIASRAVVNGEKVDEGHPLYQKYIIPMRHIMEKEGLTYVYTQVLDPMPPKCTYILDATQGSEHTPIGYRDTLPMEDYLGAQRVIQMGITYVGQVQPTKQWGLLKVSYAPIFNKNGKIEAMAGADVNITVIRKKIQVALYFIGLLGVASIILGTMVTLAMAERITRPLTRLYQRTIEVASGLSPGALEREPFPSEFIPLKNEIVRLARRLEEDKKRLEGERLAEERQKYGQRAWEWYREQSAGVINGVATWISTGVVCLPGPVTTAAGISGGKGLLFGWAKGDVPDCPSAALGIRAEIAETLKRAASKMAALEALPLAHRLFEANSVMEYIIIAQEGDAAVISGRGEALLWPAQGAACLVELGDTVGLKPGHSIIFSSDQDMLKKLVESASNKTGPFDPRWLKETIQATLEQEVMIMWAMVTDKGGPR